MPPTFKTPVLGGGVFPTLNGRVTSALVPVRSGRVGKKKNCLQFRRVAKRRSGTRFGSWSSAGSVLLKEHPVAYPTPANFNYFWSFGSLAGLFLTLQIVTGVFSAMHYTPHVTLAFASVEHIMRDVNFGWLVRYLHANGASFFFAAVYIHMAKGLYYGSYVHPHSGVWRLGVLIFIAMMATAFMGHVPPWGQMSFWGATVITNLFTAIPYIGESLAYRLWGGYAVENATLNRFYSLHYLLPFAIVGLVLLHLTLLHAPGSTQPLKLAVVSDKIAFFPYFASKDLLGVVIAAIVYSFTVFFYPNVLGHPDNYIEANALSTPSHIVPEWYSLPFHAILRSIPDKLGGVLRMGAALLVLLLLPNLAAGFGRWANSARLTLPLNPEFRPIARATFWIFTATVLLLGWIGSQPVEEPFLGVGQLATAYYFVHLLLVTGFVPVLEQSLIYHGIGGASKSVSEPLNHGKLTISFRRKMQFPPSVRGKLVHPVERRWLEREWGALRPGRVATRPAQTCPGFLAKFPIQHGHTPRGANRWPLRTPRGYRPWIDVM